MRPCRAKCFASRMKGKEGTGRESKQSREMLMSRAKRRASTTIAHAGTLLPSISVRAEAYSSGVVVCALSIGGACRLLRRAIPGLGGSRKGDGRALQLGGVPAAFLQRAAAAPAFCEVMLIYGKVNAEEVVDCERRGLQGSIRLPCLCWRRLHKQSLHPHVPDFPSPCMPAEPIGAPPRFRQVKRRWKMRHDTAKNRTFIDR